MYIANILLEHVNRAEEMYSIYYTDQMRIISYIWVLNTQLLHVSAQAYHPQGAQYARFKTNCQWLGLQGST
jgi:hypothetical protein